MQVRKEASVEYAATLAPFINQISDYALYMLDNDGGVLSWNAGAEGLLGYTVEEVIGCHFSEFCTVDDLAEDKPRRALDIAFRDGTCQVEELRVRKDATRFWATETTTALRDAEGNLQGFVKLTRDITERKMSEAALRAREGKYRTLFENSHDAILLTKPADGAFLAANPAACRLFGYSEHEFTSLRRDQVLYMADKRVAAAFAQRALTGAGSAELTFIRSDGGRFEARVSSKLFTDENGNQLSCTTIQDITETKRAEEALRRSEERFRLLYENAPLGIIQIDQNGYVTSANRKQAELTGYAQDELIGLAQAETMPPEEKAMMAERLEGIFSGRVDVFERPLLRKDGSRIWVRVNTKLMSSKPGALLEGIVILEDITEQKRAEEALLQSQEHLRSLYESAPLGIAECTLEHGFFGANSKLLEILDYTLEEITRLSVADVTHPAEREDTLLNLQKLTTGEADTYAMEKRYIRKDRSFVWVNETGSLASIPGRPRCVIMTVEDITPRKKTEEDLKRAVELSYHRANHDLLTGLPNRASCQDRLKEALAYARRDAHLVAIHLLDLDGFKSVNDSLGHQVGDVLLKEVAQRIKSNVRNTDLVARLGGDEFVVIQTHLAESAGAGVLAQKLIADLGRKYILENQDVQSGASIGIALYPDDAEDPGELMKRADLALYDAKHRGRFNYQFYREELGAACRETQRVEQDLVRALRDGEFCVHYQPEFDLKSARMVGVEALLRWRHPTRGVLAASAFLDDAERARLKPSIGEWALRTACQQYKAWFDAGLAAPLTLNLSLMQLRDVRLPDALARILEETGVPSSSLQLEMRESVLWDPKFSKRLLGQLKDRGFRLSLDRVGVEMTTLPTLDRFPVDGVKPHQGLVQRLSSQDRETAILDAIIGVAHDLNIAVCADGIEDPSQLAAAKEHGFDSAQGYLLSVPLDAEDMRKLVATQLTH